MWAQEPLKNVKKGGFKGGVAPRTTRFFTGLCSGSEAGSYFRRIDVCITEI